MKKVIHTLTLILFCASLNAQDIRTIDPAPAYVAPVVQSSEPEEETTLGEKNCDGYMMIYNRNQQLCKKGTFRKCVLTDGQEYVYDSNGQLIQIKVYKDGKYVGDSPLPERK